MLISDVMLLHDNERPHTAVRTLALLQHYNWELFDHPAYSPDLAPREYSVFIYLKNLLGSQRFKNNEELMEGSKRGRLHRRQTSLTQAYKNLFSYTSASIPAVTTLRNSLCTYFLYVIIFSHFLFF
jgi:hypothetical protein